MAYSNIEQLTVVQPGRYTLKAWVRMDGITTNEGLRIVVYNEQVPKRVLMRGDSLNGTRDWTLISQSVIVAHPGLLGVGIVREPSRKADSSIAGSFWLDDVQLVRY